MATTQRPRQSEIEALEREALAHLAAQEGHVEADLEEAAQAGELAEVAEPEHSPVRISIAVGGPVLGAAIMAGGLFTGAGGRIYACVAGVLGIALAYVARRIPRMSITYGVIVAGLFGMGLLMVVPSGISDVFRVQTLAREVATQADLTRPPIGLKPGWQAILGWLMGIVGFTAAWVALVVRKPALGLLLPLPITTIGAISVAKDQVVATGIAVFALFAVGLGVLSSAQVVGEGEEKPPLGYEVRRALRALPLLALICVGLYFLAQSEIFFPDTRIDPTQTPQKPRRVPLSEVEDRVLYSVPQRKPADLTGPWRTGVLDEYNNQDWRLPPIGDTSLRKVPASGILEQRGRSVSAEFRILGLTGGVLPSLPNTVAISGEGTFSHDPRSGNLRTFEGQASTGLIYTTFSPSLPKIDDIIALGSSITYPSGIRQFTDIADPPPEVQTLIDGAPPNSKWEQFDYLRTWILDNVTAAGAGVPKSVSPDRVADMIGGSKEGTPFEMVAAQAMLARWIGVPARIGYGFDGGEEVGGELQIRPRHGATWVEVYFPKHKWLPVIGVPKKAKPTVGSNPGNMNFDPTILPSDDIAVEVYLPVIIPPGSIFYDQLRQTVLIATPILLLLLLIYVTYPALHKAIVRNRRRNAALAAGPRARVALAYSEWRDFATDFGFGYPTDTPLMFLDRFIDDDEHTELAWLVTRALWGDLQDQLTGELAAAAEELSRSLRRRLAQAQPATVRAVATVSRLSLRNPYAPETDLSRRRKEEPHVAPVAPAPA